MSAQAILGEARATFLESLDASTPPALLAVVADAPRWRHDDPLAAIVDRIAVSAAAALEDDELAAILASSLNRAPRADGFYYSGGETVADYGRYLVSKVLVVAGRRRLEERLAEFQPAEGQE